MFTTVFQRLGIEISRNSHRYFVNGDYVCRQKIRDQVKFPLRNVGKQCTLERIKCWLQDNAWQYSMYVDPEPRRLWMVHDDWNMFPQWRFFHYSPDAFVLRKEYIQPGTENKPKGLWFSVGDEWKQWCEKENFRTQCLQYVTEFDTSALNLCKMSAYDISKHFGLDRDHVNWDSMVGQFDGVVMGGHYWDHDDFNNRWLYGWDVPSGCIWRTHKLKVVHTKLCNVSTTSTHEQTSS